MTHLVIDGDVLAFKAVSVNEKRHIVATHKETGEVREARTRTELKACVKDYHLWDIVDVQEPNPLPFSVKTAKEMIDKWMSASGASSYEVVLSGKTNFRLDLPLPTRYKSNRDGSLRPLQLSTMKQWLIDNMDASVSEDCEADDVLSMKAYAGLNNGQKVIQVTNDKDAWGCQGYIMHMDKGVVELIEGYGELWLTEERKVKGRGHAWWMCQSVFKDDADGYRGADLNPSVKFGRYLLQHFQGV